MHRNYVYSFCVHTYSPVNLSISISKMSISTTPIPTTTPPKTFYTLKESIEFESDPCVKIVYFTEKGIDLLAAMPFIGQIDRAMRNGYSWYYLIDNPPASHAETQIRIVRTSEAELAAHNAARHSVSLQVDHKAAMLAEVDVLPTSEWTQERIVDIITDYMIKHSIHDFGLADQVCEIVGSRGILKAHESTTVTPEVTATVLVEDAIIDTTMENPEQTVSSIASISAWLVNSIDSMVTSIQQLTLNILPIPCNTDWILLD